MTMRLHFDVEPCADVIVSAAARRSILVRGGGQNMFFQRFPKKCPSILKISDGLLLVIDRILQQNKYTAKMASRRADKSSAAARRSTKVGGGANKLSTRPVQGSTSKFAVILWHLQKVNFFGVL